MRSLLRTFIFSCMSLYIADYIIGGLFFGGDYLKTLSLVGLAITLLYLFLKPILKVISLPTGGPGYWFMAILMTFIVLYVMTMFVPWFEIRPTNLSGLIIFGFVLPSKSLSAIWAGIFSSLIVVLSYSFFDWLTYRK